MFHVFLQLWHENECLLSVFSHFPEKIWLAEGCVMCKSGKFTFIVAEKIFKSSAQLITWLMFACMQVNILEYQFDLQKAQQAWKNISLKFSFSFQTHFVSWSRTFRPSCDDEIENANRFIMILKILIRSKQQI